MESVVLMALESGALYFEENNGNSSVMLPSTTNPREVVLLFISRGSLVFMSLQGRCFHQCRNEAATWTWASNNKAKVHLLSSYNTHTWTPLSMSQTRKLFLLLRYVHHQCCIKQPSPLHLVMWLPRKAKFVWTAGDLSVLQASCLLAQLQPRLTKL